MKLFTEKLVVRGEKMRKIVDWKGSLPQKDLPTAYFEKDPYFYGGDKQTSLYVCPSKLIYRNEVIDEKDFIKILATMKEAKKKLSALRKKEKQLKKEWHGEETFEI